MQHRQLDMVRECVSGETDLNDAIVERLNSLGTGRFPHIMNNTNARHTDKLETITEVNSAELNSVMTPSERSSVSSSEPADEELELSGTVRSYRELHRLNKQLSELAPSGAKTVKEPTLSKRVQNASVSNLK